MAEPQVFIDCRDANLHWFGTGTEAPIINQMNSKNRIRQNLTQQIPVGRLEHQFLAVAGTIGLTIAAALIVIIFIIRKARTSEIRVWE